MTDSHGSFVWYELMSTDASAAQDFYKAVIGWGTQDSGVAGANYTLFTADGVPASGSMTLPAEASAAGAKPGWIAYVMADDVDATAAKAKELGGSVHHEPSNILGVGRFAIIADPQGAAVGVIKWEKSMDTPTAPPMTVGHAGWHELMAQDWPKAFEFYASLFGWTKKDPIDMGAMGTYQLFATGADAVGGMMNKPEPVPACFWLYYFVVDAIDTAVDRVKTGGGQIINGPMEVPGGAWIVQCLDPQGVMFALVAGKR